MYIGIEPNMDEYVDGLIACPVCENTYHLTDLLIHVMNEHQQFLLVWSALQVSSTRSVNTTRDITLYNFNDNHEYEQINIYTPDEDNDDSDDYDEYVNDTYELLSRICEMIGDHVVRMTKQEIDTYAPFITYDELSELDQNKCPVCLEMFTISNDVRYRRVQACQHVFCAECLETWLSRKRTCPLCRSHLVDDIISN